MSKVQEPILEQAKEDEGMNFRIQLLGVVCILVGGLVAVGFMLDYGMKRSEASNEAWLQNQLERIAELDEEAKQRCSEEIFYAANFERCERLEVRP